MVWFDVFILGVVIASVLVSVYRGFFREALSLTAWVVAIIGAVRLAPYLAPQFASLVENEAMLTVIAFVVSFLFLLILLSILNMFIVRLWPDGLKGVDKTLGALFGLIRGGLLVAMVVMIAELTTIPQAIWWQKSAFVPAAQYVSNQIRAWIPNSGPRHSEDFSTFGGLSK
jgi:membrane protein required for colicin V production